MLPQSFLDVLHQAIEDSHEAARAVALAADWRTRLIARRKAQKKQILAGFPRTRPFRDNEEARAYLAEKELTCLVCGKAYRQLAGHLRNSHGIDPDAYRTAYNIPLTSGLSCPPTRQRRSANLKGKLADPEFASVWFAQAEQWRQNAHEKAKDQRHLPFRKGLSLKHLEKAGVTIGRWQETDYLRLLELMKTKDALLVDIAGKVDNTPSLASARKWFYSTPARHQLLVETIHQLSNRCQARAGKIGPRLTAEVRKLRDTGKLLREIGEITGLTVMTVAKLTVSRG